MTKAFQGWKNKIKTGSNYKFTSINSKFVIQTNYFAHVLRIDSIGTAKQKEKNKKILIENEDNRKQD